MYDAIGKLILRATLGCLILLHGMAKLMNGIDYIAQVVTQAGLPAFFAYGVYVGEVLAPILLIVGWYSRLGAALIAVNMLFAIGLVHSGEVLRLGQGGGWAIEAQAMFLFTAIALVLMGPGRYSFNQK